MTAEDEKLVVGFDAVDLEMIRRGDMLGPRLGRRTYDALTTLSTEVQELRAALIASGRAVGAGLADTVSSDFLTHVPGEVALVVGGLRAALSDIIKADDEFRASLPATADRDPVTLACDRARAALKPETGK